MTYSTHSDNWAWTVNGYIYWIANLINGWNVDIESFPLLCVNREIIVDAAESYSNRVRIKCRDSAWLQALKYLEIKQTDDRLKYF